MWDRVLAELQRQADLTVSDQGSQFHNRTSLPGQLLPVLVSVVAVAVAIIMVVGTWNDTGAATGELSMRIFLVGWMVSAVIILSGFSLAPRVSHRGRSSSLLALLSVVCHVAVGVVVGLAVGTTDWTELQFAGWWQLWWTVPLLLLYAGFLVNLRWRSRG